MDDFEQLLKSQPLRTVPPEWRNEILTAAKVGGARKEKVKPAWQGWLWPSPYAWGTLAAAWLAIIGLNLAAEPKYGHEVTRGPVPTRQEIYTALAERRRELEEFLPVAKVRPATLPIPRPDSSGAWVERRESETLNIA